jgi:anti-sigma B factor antagonist
MSFDVSIKKKSDVLIISLCGKVDISSHEHLVKLLYDAIGSKNNKIILDLSEVSFISSNGIGAIVESSTFIGKNGGSFVITGLNSKISYIFQLIGLLDNLVFLENQDEAFRALSETARV